MSRKNRKREALLHLIEEGRPLSIYGLAKTAGRNYRRVHDHVHSLAAAGRVALRRDHHGGRRVVIVESISAQRLRRLDELYAFEATLT